MPADPTHPDQPGQRAAVPRLLSTLMSRVHGPGAYGLGRRAHLTIDYLAPRRLTQGLDLIQRVAG
jgi:hypothetical protein